MIPQRLRLEVFGSAEDGDRASVLLDGEEIEDARLAAFEQGYKAGWDDAAASQSDDAAQQRAMVARAIAAIHAEQEAARQHVLAALRPLLEQMVAVVLPAAARAALPAIIADAVIPYAELATEQPVDIVLNPAAAAAAEAVLLEADAGPLLRLVEDASVSEGQAILRCGTAETQVDLDAAIARVSQALAEFFASNR